MAASIKKDIHEGAKSKVYLVWGDEEFLRDHYSLALKEKLLDKDFADFNFRQYTTKKPDTDEIDIFFSSYPYMSEKKIVYIKDSGLFKKISEDEKKFWTNLFRELPDFAVIIFSEKTADKRNALYKMVNSDFVCDEFPFQKREDLTSWIMRYFTKYEKHISTEDAAYLIDCCSENMYLLKSEIEKLVYFKKHSKTISKEDIDTCSCKIPESRVFKMIDDIFDGNIKSAAQKLDELKLLKEKPIALCGAVFSKYSQIRKEKILSKTMSPAEIASKTKQNPYFVNLHLRQSKNISIEMIDEVIDACQNLDYKVKSGLSDSWTEFELLFAIMCKNSHL